MARRLAPANQPKIMQASLKLPLQFEAALLQADLRAIAADAFVAHFNTRYYQGDWSVAPLRSSRRPRRPYLPGPDGQRRMLLPTPRFWRGARTCGSVLASLPCPRQAVRFMRLKGRLHHQGASRLPAWL
jgi:hypothetical protein